MKNILKKILITAVFTLGAFSVLPDTAQASVNENEGRFALNLCIENGAITSACQIPDPEGPCDIIKKCKPD